MKQSKLRKRRVVRFAILYFAMLVLFIVLLVAPIILHNMTSISKPMLTSLWSAIGVNGANSQMLYLLQPMDKGLNDTVSYYTGSNLPDGYKPVSTDAQPATTGDSATYVRRMI